MQHKLATWASADQTRRFDRLLRLITDRNWLAEAARIVLASSGASTPGLDGMDKQRLAAHLEHHLERLRVALLDGSYRPTPVKRSPDHTEIEQMADEELFSKDSQIQVSGTEKNENGDVRTLNQSLPGSALFKALSND